MKEGFWVDSPTCRPPSYVEGRRWDTCSCPTSCCRMVRPSSRCLLYSSGSQGKARPGAPSRRRSDSEGWASAKGDSRLTVDTLPCPSLEFFDKLLSSDGLGFRLSLYASRFRETKHGADEVSTRSQHEICFFRIASTLGADEMKIRC